MIFDVIGDFFTDGCQFKHLLLDDRIVCLFGKLPIHCRLIPEIIRPIHRAKPTGRRLRHSEQSPLRLRIETARFDLAQAGAAAYVARILKGEKAADPQ